jgi:acetolactate synthase-1/2/3 large subunit
MNVAEYIIKFLEENGVKHVFTVVGGGCIFLEDALSKSNITPIFCMNEQGATIAAEAYSQCGGVGVALVTTGPGVTNALTGVAGAYLESTPMLIISGQVNTYHSSKLYSTRQYGFQELDTQKLVSSIVKSYIKLEKLDTKKSNIDHGLNYLLLEMKRNRPGPVWLDVPLDIQNAKVIDE